MPSGPKKRKAAAKKKELQEDNSGNAPDNQQQKKEEAGVEGESSKVKNQEEDLTIISENEFMHQSLDSAICGGTDTKITNDDKCNDREDTQSNNEVQIVGSADHVDTLDHDHQMRIEILEGKLKSNAEKVERVKMNVMEGLRVTDNLRDFLEKMLDDLNSL
ncbi:hypothetical protein OROGR_004328 [Orobanche gracilis]